MQTYVLLAVLFFVGVNGDSSSSEERNVERKLKERLLEHERFKGFSFHEKVELVAEKAIDFFLKNPTTLAERQCFAKLKLDESVDFVIDIAASPSMDAVDKLVAECPAALYLQRGHRSSVTKSYIDSIAYFIEAVTIDMKPEQTHAIIYDSGRKFFIRGRDVNEELNHYKEGGDFNDLARNLKTMWPSATKSEHEDYLKSIVKNNLGRLIKLALWNRDNGIPAVLSGSKRSKGVYTIVITDGASGAKIHDLTENLERTTVIDIGNQRFLKNINWKNFNELASVFSVPAPQAIWTLTSTCRMMACRLCSK